MRQNGASGPGAPEPQTKELDLRDLVNLVRRNVWLILAIASVVIGLTAWYTWSRPEIYQATATMQLDADQPRMPEFEFLSTRVRGQDVETEMALLRARSIAEAAIDSLSLQVQVAEPAGRPRATLFSEMSATRATREGSFVFDRTDRGYTITDELDREVGLIAPGEAIVFNGMRLVLHPDPDEPLPPRFTIATLDHRDAVGALMESVSVGQPYREARLIAVTHEGTDPLLVAQVPNAITGEFIALRRAFKKTEARSTVAFLSEQIGSYTEQLRQAEEALLAFRQGEQVVNLEAEGAEQVRRLVEGQAQRDQLAGELQSLDEILTQIRETDRSTLDLQSPFRRLAAFPTFLQNQAVTQLMSDLNRLETELQDQSTRRRPNHPDVVALRRGVDQLEDQLFQLAINYRSSLENQIQSLDGRLADFGGQLEQIPEKALQEARLQRQQQVLEEVHTLLQNRLKEAEIAQAVEPGDLRVVDDAIVPLDPIRPRKVRSMVLAVLFGLVAGIGVAATRDYMDETVHSRDDLLRLTGLPVLGMIPRIKGLASGNGRPRRRKDLGDRLVTRNEVGSPVSEAYRAFRTNITFLGIDEPPRLLLLTSPGPSEGKSTSVVNLAMTLSQQGARTLVVDCDLRRGVVHRVFGEEAEPGVTNVLLGEVSLEDAVRRVEGSADGELHLLPTGALPPNPSELLSSRHMRELLRKLREDYDMVLLDSPPLNLVTDAAVLGAETDGVILVARAGATEQGALRYALEQLHTVQARIAGAVLNDLDFQGRGKYYGSGYGYGYYHKYYRAESGKA